MLTIMQPLLSGPPAHPAISSSVGLHGILFFVVVATSFVGVDLYRPRCVLGLFFEEQIVIANILSACCGGRWFTSVFFVYAFLVAAVPAGPFIFLAITDLGLDDTEVIAL